MSLPCSYFLAFCLLFNVGVVIDVKSQTKQKSPEYDPVIKYYSDTTVIRYDYKQSALFHEYTFAAIDSIVDIVKKNKDITLSIDGYAFKDEGSDTICYWISYNRADFLRTYILGRGIDKSRIVSFNAFGSRSQRFKNIDAGGLNVYCRAELIINRPKPPEKIIYPDRDFDGVYDKDDLCPDVFGHADKEGCPDSLLVVVPFPVQQYSLFNKTYAVLDSVVAVLRNNPSYSINIYGHAYTTEGTDAVCKELGFERADIVKGYLMSRMIGANRIKEVKNFANSRPLNAGKTPLDVINNARAEIKFIPN